MPGPDDQKAPAPAKDNPGFWQRYWRAILGSLAALIAIIVGILIATSGGPSPNAAVPPGTPRGAASTTTFTTVPATAPKHRVVVGPRTTYTTVPATAPKHRVVVTPRTTTTTVPGAVPLKNGAPSTTTSSTIPRTSQAFPGSSGVIIPTNSLNFGEEGSTGDICHVGGTLHLMITIDGIAANTPVQVIMIGPGVPPTLSFHASPGVPFVDAFPIGRGGTWTDRITSIGGRAPPSSEDGVQESASWQC